MSAATHRRAHCRRNALLSAARQASLNFRPVSTRFARFSFVEGTRARPPGEVAKTWQTYRTLKRLARMVFYQQEGDVVGLRSALRELVERREEFHFEGLCAFGGG
jgi:hypothetical protein